MNRGMLLLLYDHHLALICSSLIALWREWENQRLMVMHALQTLIEQQKRTFCCSMLKVKKLRNLYPDGGGKELRRVGCPAPKRTSLREANGRIRTKWLFRHFVRCRDGCIPCRQFLDVIITEIACDN